MNMTSDSRVAIYARISEDDDGLEAGVTRQLGDARALVQQRGWTVVAEHSDNNISAFTGKARPGYAALLADAMEGRIDRIVVFHPSRLWRNRRERAEGIEHLQRAKVSVTAVKGPDLDLSSAYGRGMAGLLGEFDSMESEVKSERIERVARERAEAGDPNGAIPFGWTRVIETNDRGVRIGARDVHHPEQAPVVREVCERLLAGESLHSVTDWLNESGIPAPGAKFQLRARERGVQNPDGTRWGKTAVRKLALRATNAGLRKYHAGRPDERLMPAKVEPIITRDQWERLTTILTDPARVKTRDGARKHFLSHTDAARCGVCGDVLRSSTRKGKHGKPHTLYVCQSKSGCVGRAQAPVDALVADALLERLSRPDARDLLLAEDDDLAQEAMDRAQAIRARLAQAADKFADGTIDVDQLERITMKLRPQLQAAEAEAQAARPDLPRELVDLVAVGDRAAERWAGLSVPQRTRIAEALLTVRILPRGKGGPGFEPESVEIKFEKRGA